MEAIVISDDEETEEKIRRSKRAKSAKASSVSAQETHDHGSTSRARPPADSSKAEDLVVVSNPTKTTDPPSNGQWACIACTLINADDVSECKVCGTARASDPCQVSTSRTLSACPACRKKVSGIYTIDGCSHRGCSSCLPRLLARQCNRTCDLIKTRPTDLVGALSMLHCTQCDRPLSRSDMDNLVPHAPLLELDRLVCDVVQRCVQARAQSSAAAAAAAAAPAKGGAGARSKGKQVATSTTPTPTATATATATTTTTRSQAASGTWPDNNRDAELCAEVFCALEELGRLMGCVGVGGQSGKEPSKGKGGGEGSGRADNKGEAMGKDASDSDEEEDDEDEAPRGKRRGRGGRGRGRGSSSGHYKSKRGLRDYSAHAWEKGTGFGGGEYGEDFTRAELDAQARAVAREVEADGAVTRQLVLLASALKGGGREGGASAASLHPAVGALLHTHPALGRCLLSLLHNDCMMDVGRRLELYAATVELIRILCRSTTTLAVLDRPPTLADGSISDMSVADALGRLQMQASVFTLGAQKRVGGQLSMMAKDGMDEEETGAMCLALDVKDVHEQLKTALDVWRRSRAQSPGALYTGASKAGGDSDEVEEVGGSSQPHVAASAYSALRAMPLEQRRKHYVSKLAPLQFGTALLLGSEEGGGNFYFRNRMHDDDDDGYSGGGSHMWGPDGPPWAGAKRKVGTSGGGLGGQHTRNRQLHITKEISSLSTSLPLAYESSVHVRMDDDRMDVLRALILPPSDTPYGGGAFLFDILLPPDYPQVPPKVHFLTTGGGTVRFNPNLYEEGKVCLSLLGTWHGPGWIPGTSTLLQVLVSIQSLIFTGEPYFNEPSYERQRGTKQGDKENSNYNELVRMNTLYHALLPAIKRPLPPSSPLAPFEELLTLHYTIKRDDLLHQLDEWIKEFTSSNKDRMKPTVSLIRSALNALEPSDNAS
eukprot:jgi/Mesvir1/1873/Mv22908-RA.1